MPAPFFSIIIPALNSEASIHLSVLSILNQKFNDFEILIMDGNSSDDTLKIVNSYDDSRIKVSSQRDKGVYDGMNKGIDVAQGEWLYFLGSDDELFNDEVLINVKKELDDKKSRVYYGDVFINGDTSWAKHGHIYDGVFNIDKLLSRNICHQAIFYNRSVFRNHGKYNIDYRVCADYDLNLRLAARYQFTYMPICVARFKGGGISASADTNFYSNYAYLVVTYYKKFLFERYFKKRINLLVTSGKRLLLRKQYSALLILGLAFLYHKLNTIFSIKH